MRTKNFREALLFKSFLFLLLSAATYFWNLNSVGALCVLLFPVIPFKNRYIFRFLPPIERNVLVNNPRNKWKQCVISETSCILGIIIIMLILFIKTDDGYIEAASTLPFTCCTILLYVFANITPETSLKRSVYRWIFSILTIFSSVAELTLLCDIESDPSSLKCILGFAYFASLLLTWIVSVRMSYNIHVKVMEYQD